MPSFNYTRSKMAINSEKIDKFQEQGFLFIPNYFDHESVETFRDEADRILELIINSSIALDRKSGRLEIVNSEDGKTIRAVNPASDLSKVFRDVAVEALPELHRSLCGEDYASIDRTFQINYKQPITEPLENLTAESGNESYPVHADKPFYQDFYSAGHPNGVITSAVFIDKCTEQNGAIEVWPETHKEEICHESNGSGMSVPRSALDHHDSVVITGPPGSLLLFDYRLVHSSSKNETEDPRRVAVYGHAPTKNVSHPITDGTVRIPGTTNPSEELIESTYEHEYYRRKRHGDFDDVWSSN